MHIRLFAFAVSTVLLVVALWGCAGTTLQNVWKDDGYAGRVTSVLVLGATKDRTIRRMFESELSALLRTKGINAIPSFSLFMSDDVIDKNVILDKAQESQIDSVLITQVLDVKSYKERITDINHMPRYPGFYRYSDCYMTYRHPCGWYDYYWTGYSTVRTYDIEYLVSHAETGLYLLEGERMVWSALTETETVDDVAESVREMVTVIVNQLEKDGMI